MAFAQALSARRSIDSDETKDDSVAYLVVNL
jgi:hypothetical protein